MDLSTQIITKGMSNPATLISKGFINSCSICTKDGQEIPIKRTGFQGYHEFAEEVSTQIDKIGYDYIDHIKININPFKDLKDIKISMEMVKIKIEAELLKRYKNPIKIKMYKIDDDDDWL